MKKVTIMSRWEYVHIFVPKKESVAIRIDSLKPKESKKDSLYKDVLYLNFEDDTRYLGDNYPEYPYFRVFDKTDVEKIDKFIEKNKEYNFVVHCSAGISRSSAVGYYILEKLNYLSELLEKKMSQKYQPNLEIWCILHNKILTRENETDIMIDLGYDLSQENSTELLF